VVSEASDRQVALPGLPRTKIAGLTLVSRKHHLNNLVQRNLLMPLLLLRLKTRRVMIRGALVVRRERLDLKRSEDFGLIRIYPILY